MNNSSCGVFVSILFRPTLLIRNSRKFALKTSIAYQGRLWIRNDEGSLRRHMSSFVRQNYKNSNFMFEFLQLLNESIRGWDGMEKFCVSAALNWISVDYVNLCLNWLKSEIKNFHKKVKIFFNKLQIVIEKRKT